MKKLMGFVTTILFVTIIFWTCGNAYGVDFITDGLIGFWSLDKNTINGNTIKDLWGNNDGTITGAPKTVEGVIGEALEFDGTTDFIQLSDMGKSDTATVEAWILPHSFPAMAGIVSALTSDPGMVHFKIESDKRVTIDKRDNGDKAGSAIEQDQWFHVLYVCDVEEDKIDLYVNGELKGGTPSGAAQVDLTGLMIGREKTDRYFPGIIDEVRVYNRVLSENEINQNYNVKSNAMSVEKSGKLTTYWGEMK